MRGIMDLQGAEGQYNYYWSYVADDEYCWKHYPNDYAEGCMVEDYRYECEELAELEAMERMAYYAEEELYKSDYEDNKYWTRERLEKYWAHMSRNTY